MKFYFIIFITLLFIATAKAQNVGIGTTSPVAKLDIIGTIKITDASQGAGKVLTSDANGLASWSLPAPPSFVFGTDQSLGNNDFIGLGTSSSAFIRN